jgi:hypothetical protein
MGTAGSVEGLSEVEQIKLKWDYDQLLREGRTQAETKQMLTEMRKFLPQIRVIDFELFKAHNEMPRYPDNDDLTSLLMNVMIRDSFVIFVSHAWLATTPGTQYRNRPHPDTKLNQKYKLIVEAVEKLKVTCSFKRVYLWIDYCCVDQSVNPGKQMRQLEKLMSCCDCLLTPVVDEDPNSWDYPEHKRWQDITNYKVRLSFTSNEP